MNLQQKREHSMPLDTPELLLNGVPLKPELILTYDITCLTAEYSSVRIFTKIKMIDIHWRHKFASALVPLYLTVTYRDRFGPRRARYRATISEPEKCAGTGWCYEFMLDRNSQERLDNG